MGRHGDPRDDPWYGRQEGGNDTADMTTTYKAGISHIPQPFCMRAVRKTTNDACASGLHLQTGHFLMPYLFSVIRLCRRWKQSLPACAGSQLATPLETAAAALRLLLGGGHLGGYFSDKVTLPPLDTPVHHVECRNLHGRAGGLERLLNGLLIIFHKRLVQ